MAAMTTHVAGLLEGVVAEEPACLINPDGTASGEPGLEMPDDGVLLELYRRLVTARRFDRQATSLTRQGRLAVYPSAGGQEACQVGAVLALGPEDWMFPTYRETVALVTRGIPAREALSLLRGEWHCGYDPYRWRTAPQCTPLATQALHAVGLGFAARLKHEKTAVLVFLGDGATSEGDAGEAMNFAAVFNVPAVFFIQNNQYAISVPLSKQTKSPTLAHRAIGYGVPGYRVDGNDVVAVRSMVSRLLDVARDGGGPAVIEAVTYRMEAHTNADDAGRYRSPDEANAWVERDPLVRLETYLTDRGVLDHPRRDDIAAAAERFASSVRESLSTDLVVEPDSLFSHVYRRRPAMLEAEAAMVAEELRLAAEDGGPA
ncbi:MAG TPA: thiamine pyrophosphate-dependent enzyme [Acidimicrobiales bacterium]|nr:thiamine pyrophosphate-dependent enzyme [Acidimicrobiales bacterium]